jgi:Putative auto-transporter adhesin, head GIN domain
MKKFLVFAFVSMTLFTNSFAQNMRPLTGNGVEKKLTYDIAAFESLEVLWIDGKIDVEFGAAKSDISIETDENIFSLLKVTNTEGVLKLEIPTNYGNRLWLEDDRTTIKIRTTAQARRITYKANANARFTNINSPILSIHKDENGDILLEGKAAILEIEKKDNGNIDAENLLAQQATVSMTGNGNVSVNAKLLKKQRVWGNGGVSNKMEVVDTGGAINTEKLYLKRVNVTLFNPEPLQKEYYVSGTNKFGRKFSYGLELKGMGKQSEVLPVGTNFYRKGKLIATLKESDENKEIRL